jgi:hypothetical protein
VRSAAQTTHPDLLLAEDMARLYADPMGFVMYAFDWAGDEALRVVRLPEPWSFVYDSEYGPDAWACELLDEIGSLVRERGFDGVRAVDPLRFATASGHGIGKSAFVAWLILWLMSTRPHCKGVVTANTAEQLASKTWAELGKWRKRCITGHWFDYSAGKGSMRMVHRQHPESWRVDAQTCREENSESFAGLHAASSSPWYIFDEASAVPASIWEVSEGGMTDGEPHWYTFGNPTRNSGKFAECFGAQRHRWRTRQIDSRAVRITNKRQLDEWVADYGEDSDFVRVRVRGVFPRASSMQFIGRDLYDAAAARLVGVDRTSPVVVGVDVARFGDDESVIRTRAGRDARSWEPIRLREVDTMQLVGRIAEHVNLLHRASRRATIFVDGGGVGGGVVDRLRQLGFDCVEVQFGGKADDPRKYANKRAEMWDRLREWLAIGAIGADERLATDLTGVEYGFTNGDQIILERKERMRERGLASPDDADALALTFAHQVPVELPADAPRPARRVRGRDYNPYEPR